MNRRNFLKSVAAACGAVVVCPGELLKGEFRPNPIQKMWIGHRKKLPWKHFQMTRYYDRNKLIMAYQGQYYEP